MPGGHRAQGVLTTARRTDSDIPDMYAHMCRYEAHALPYFEVGQWSRVTTIDGTGTLFPHCKSNVEH